MTGNLDIAKQGQSMRSAPCKARYFLLCLLALMSAQVQASYSIYVGKNHSTDGNVLIGGSGDEVSSHWLVSQRTCRSDSRAR